MSKNILPKSYLKPLLLEKKYTLNDLKAEVVLMLVENFIGYYIYSEETGQSKNIFDDTKFEELGEEDKIILNRLKTLREQIINSGILTIEKLNNEILNKSLFLQMSYSPYTILYNAGIEILIKKKEELFTTEEEKVVWLPDVLSIFLILDAKEKDIDFSKFPFIEKDDFVDLITFFKETDAELKRINSCVGYRNPSVVAKTLKISNSIVEKIVSIK